MKSSLRIFLPALMVLCMLSDAALAAFASGTASPASVTVPANAPAVKPVTWTLNRTGGAGNVTLSSQQADVLLDGNSIYTINKTLPKTINTTLNNTIFVISETLTIPRSVVARALKSGGTLTLRRTFLEESTAFTRNVDVALSIGSSSSADFNVTRIDLAFSDSTNSCQAKSGKPLKAIAKIEASGAGLLRGEWQIRKGGNLGAFRTLRTVQTAITSGNNTAIESPELPLDDSDRFDVRLVVTAPDIAFTEPVIYCLVSGKASVLRKRGDSGKEAEVIAPPPHSPLNDKTMVRWKPVDGAKSYRIDIVTEENGEPVASQMAKKDSKQSSLSPLTLEKLRADERYSVRVIVE
jgi:hypothetical protein